jgi:uncharacterized protein (TIGR03435 family)
MWLSIVIAAVAIGGVQAQTQFEVASVKVNDSGGPGGSMRTTPGGRLEATNSNMRALIRYAYNVKDFQVEGAPRWFDAARYDVSAKAPAKATTPEIRVMVQKLLAERFALVIHRETKEIPVYDLARGKQGARVKENLEGDTAVASGSGEIRGTKMTMTMLANQLATALGRPVINKTGLQATYDVDLHWSPEGDPDQPSIFAAVQEQLGLRLEAAKGPVEVLVIDSVNRVPVAN